MLTAGLISEWTQTMSSVSKNISDFTTTYGFEGSSADALKTYFSEVHSTVLVPSIQIALQGLYDKVTLYAGNYYSIDADIHAQFNYDTFSEAISRVNIEKTNFENEADLFESALDSISDLFAPGKPDRTVLEQAFADLKTYVTNLQEDVGEHETAYTTEAETVSEMICDIKSIISEYMGKNPSEIYTYQSGNVTLAGNYSDLCSGVQDILTYHQENSARLSECEEYRAEVQTQLDIERAEDEAKAKIINSVVAIGGIAVGCVVTVASGGTLGPVVATFAVAAISYNGAELYEGVDSYLLASSGDPYTQATNPLRDTIFFGNDTAYDIFGFTANTGFALTNGLALGKVTKMTNGQVLANVLVDMGKDEIFGRAADFSLDVLGDVTGHEFSQTERALINGAVSIGGNARDLYGAYHPKTTDGTGVRVNDVDTNGIDTTFGNVRVNADDSINLRNGITSDTTDVDAHGSHHTADGDNNGMVRNHDGTADNRQGDSPAFGRNSSGDGTDGGQHTADGDSNSAKVRDNDNDNVRDTNNNDHVRDTGSDSVRDTADNNASDITDNGASDTAESSAQDTTDNNASDTADSNAQDATDSGESDTADNDAQDATDSDASDTADNNAHDATDNSVQDTTDNNAHDITDNGAIYTAESSAQDVTDNGIYDTVDNGAQDVADGVESKVAEFESKLKSPEEYSSTLEFKAQNTLEQYYKNGDGELTNGQKESITNELKSIYDNTSDTKDVLVPENSKDVTGIYWDKDNNRYNIVYNWKEIDTVPETRTMEVVKEGQQFDRVGPPSGRCTAAVGEDGSCATAKERSVPYHLTEDDITKEPSYHRYQAEQDFTRENLANAIDNSIYDDVKKADMHANLNYYYKKAQVKGYGDGDGLATGEIAPMFEDTVGATGGGKQYDMPLSMEELGDIGMISEVEKGTY